MMRSAAWARSWTVLRLAMALLGAAAIVTQAVVTIGGAIDNGRHVATVTANFFSFFTILSNVASVVVLTWAAVWFWSRGRSGDPSNRTTVRAEPPALALALASVTTYMIVTGVVYNTLLRSIPLPQGTTVPWSNEVLHVVVPLFLLLDLFLGPCRRALRWRMIWAVLVFPLAWVVYALLRANLIVNPLTDAPYWYPYPFLDPHQDGGYGAVAAYVVAIAAAIIAVAALVLWVGRRRNAPRA